MPGIEPPFNSCTGGFDCRATEHIHGCYKDFGICDDPWQHERAETIARRQAQQAATLARGAKMRRRQR